MPDKPDTLIGQTVGGCKILSRIGSGGMGEVYLANHLGLRKTVALKFLRTSLTENPDFVKRFIREARAAAQLEHPNIVQVFNIGKKDETYYIVMQHVEGQSLDSLIRKEGPMEPARAARIVRQVASALSSAHTKGIMHRDIKPENILISSEGQAKVADFGLARSIKVESNISRTGDVIGTPHFMAPEQARGDVVDGRCDIYSLGATFYYMLTGARPFEGDSAISIIMKHITENLPSAKKVRPDLPDPLSKLVEKMLAKNPADRPQSADELMQELDQLYPPTSSVVRPRRPLRWSYLPRELRLAIPIAAVAAAIIGAFFIFHPFSVPPEEDLFRKAEAYWRGNPDSFEEAIARFTFVNTSYPNTKWGKTASAEVEEIKKKFHQAAEIEYLQLFQEIQCYRDAEELEKAAALSRTYPERFKQFEFDEKLQELTDAIDVELTEDYLRERCEGFVEAVMEEDWEDAANFLNPEDIVAKGKEQYVAYLKGFFGLIKFFKVKFDHLEIHSIEIHEDGESASVDASVFLKVPDKQQLQEHRDTQKWVLKDEEWYLRVEDKKPPKPPRRPGDRLKRDE